MVLYVKEILSRCQAKVEMSYLVNRRIPLVGEPNSMFSTFVYTDDTLRVFVVG